MRGRSAWSRRGGSRGATKCSAAWRRSPPPPGDGAWQVTFTTEQVNGWLAVDREENYPHSLPQSIKDPRVVIRPGEIDLGCRYKSSRLTAILSVTADVYMQAPDLIALRIRGARAGVVPLPLEKLLERLTQLFENLGCRVTRQQADADPVLLLTWPQPRDPGHKGTMHIDQIDLREGEMFVAGHTQRSAPAGSR